MAPKLEQASGPPSTSPVRPSQVVHESSAMTPQGQHIEVKLERVSTSGTKHRAKFMRSSSGAMTAAERAQKKHVRTSLFPHTQAAFRSKDSERKRAAAVAKSLHDAAEETSLPPQPPQQLQQLAHLQSAVRPPLAANSALISQPPGSSPLPAISPPSSQLPQPDALTIQDAAMRAKKLHDEAQQRLRDRKRQLGPAYERCWANLSESERGAAAAFGFNGSSWDSRASGECRLYDDAWDGKEECGRDNCTCRDLNDSALPWPHGRHACDRTAARCRGQHRLPAHSITNFSGWRRRARKSVCLLSATFSYMQHCTLRHLEV